MSALLKHLIKPVALRPGRQLPYLWLLAVAAITCLVSNEGEKAKNADLSGRVGYSQIFPTAYMDAEGLSSPYSVHPASYAFNFCNQLNKIDHMSTQSLSLTAGIVTTQLHACQQFYTSHFGFQVIYESDWFVLMATPDGKQQISFLQPQHPSQQALFQPAFAGKGVYFTLEVEDVAAEYERIKKAGIPILIDLRQEPWGDTHFAIQDPAGVAVDIVTYQPPQ